VSDRAPKGDHTHVVSNGKRELTLDELALMQPGMDRLMAEVGPRTHRLYYAGLAGNWRLADYFYRSMVKQLKLCATSRPKYDPDMTAFVDDDCVPVRDAIRDRDVAAFRSAYDRMVDRANHYHEVFGKPYIKWVTPAEPPHDLDLTAGASE
jgi:hypothetical protein